MPSPDPIIPLESALEIAGALLYTARHPSVPEIDGAIRCLQPFDDPRAVETIEELRMLKPAEGA